jgi:endonuclease YncB( thermonuclease family)
MFRPRFFSAAVLIALGVMLAALLNRQSDEVVTGKARAIDGDSLLVDGREMRLKGIDAPEAKQTCLLAGQTMPCGRQASAALQRWLNRGVVLCTGNEIDRFGRLLVICRVNGTDINADLVRNGFAVDYGLYPAEEREARAQYRGLWAGEFERPEQYRRRQRDERGSAANLPENRAP